MLVPFPSLFAQDGSTVPVVVTPENLPPTTQLQLAATSDELFGEQPMSEQTATHAGVAEAEPDSAQQLPSAPGPLPASIGGTVTDVNGGVVGGATIALESANPGDRQAAIASDSGAFEFHNVRPGIQYHITVTATEMESWKSPPIVLNPGQFFLLTDIKLKLPGAETSVTVYASREQIATEQVIVEEKQRVFGFIPNFYVTYDPHPVPLTTKLKYRLALKVATDPVTFFGVAFMSAVYQAGDVPDYQQGWDGYAQRFGAGYADTVTDVFFGGAILPGLLHQDPRYFYQGTGTKKSRALHAMSSPYICKGDNGKTQPNYSSLGGDLISGAISNIYYPETNRGVGLVFEGFAVTTAVRTVNSLIQEFVLRKLTPSARQKN
jgi:Carboxypeptidase regulatory-like domain